MWKSVWSLLRGEYGGRTVGVALGIVCGFLYLFAGLWDTLIFAFIVYIGYFVGSRIDRGQIAFNWRPFLIWLTQRWRGFK